MLELSHFVAPPVAVPVANELYLCAASAVISHSLLDCWCLVAVLSVVVAAAAGKVGYSAPDSAMTGSTPFIYVSSSPSSASYLSLEEGG